MTRGIHRLLLLATTAISLIAADATGTWKGELITAQGEGSGGPAFVVLKQDGAKLTGTAGRDADEQYAIQNGKAENGSLTFEVTTGDITMKFALKQDQDLITGDVTRERDGRTQRAKLNLKRD